jgi:hypothetical protein
MTYIEWQTIQWPEEIGRTIYKTLQSKLSSTNITKTSIAFDFIVR